MNIVSHKNWYFGLSVILIAASVAAIVFWGLNLSIDFTGGSRLTFSFEKTVDDRTISKVKEIFEKESINVGSIQKSENSIFVRTAPIESSKYNMLIDSLSDEFKDVKQQELEIIGPVIGREITLNALKAIVIASVLIVIYVTWSFRKVPKPASSLRFGICTIITLVHDAVIVLGLFAVLGWFLDVEINALFVTAILTVIGFSVHDTIVVFDRIRENLIKTNSQNFVKTVNESILQTIGRSLNTSLTAVLVLSAMLFFGGESIFWFVVALLAGVIIGTYSSIFTASPLLVLWHEISMRRQRVKN
jgi:preprotein translocase subunit SecF